MLYVQRDMLLPATTAITHIQKKQQYPLLWNVCVDKHLTFFVCSFECKAAWKKLNKSMEIHGINMKHLCLINKIGACSVQPIEAIQYIWTMNEVIKYHDALKWTRGIQTVSYIQAFRLINAHIPDVGPSILHLITKIYNYVLILAMFEIKYENYCSSREVTTINNLKKCMRVLAMFSIIRYILCVLMIFRYKLDCYSVCVYTCVCFLRRNSMYATFIHMTIMFRLLVW